MVPDDQIEEERAEDESKILKLQKQLEEKNRELAASRTAYKRLSDKEAHNKKQLKQKEQLLKTTQDLLRQANTTTQQKRVELASKDHKISILQNSMKEMRLAGTE